MTVKTVAQLKAEYQSTDPQDFINDLCDTLDALVDLNSTAGLNKLATGLFTNTKVLTCAGHNLAGACTLTGAVVGDRVIAVAGLTTVRNAKTSFESTIAMADQIQQSAASDLSTKNYVVILAPVYSLT